MVRTKHFIAVLLTYTMAIMASLQSKASPPIQTTEVFVGSTPGDSHIKALLNIPANATIDFIRWELALSKKVTNANKFVLNIVFGEGQPNTSGFKGGGEKRSYEGEYTVSTPTKQMLNGEIYRLKMGNVLTPISLIKLNANLLHVLTPAGNLMVGNGGWGYTLNRKEPVANSASGLSPLAASFFNDTARQVIFEGRTPCRDFAKQYHLKVSDDCFKLKWKCILYRDSSTFLPTTYSLEGTLFRSRKITGKWKIIKGLGSNPNAIIYQLDAGLPNETISFLVGDKNVLFFLDKEMRLFTGDENFSYTLNRRK